MVALAVGLWHITPGSLVPDEDQGFYISAVILPDGATLERTFKVVAQVEEAIRSNPNNQDTISFTGFDFIGGGFRNNAATIFVTQKPWDERTVTAAQLVGELYGKTAGIKEALVLAFNPPPIFGLGTAGGFEFYIQNRGEGGAKRLSEVTQAFLADARRSAARLRADVVARDRAAVVGRRGPREGEDARRSHLGRLQRALRDARQLSTSTTSPSRARVAGADVGGAAISQPSRRHRRDLRALGPGRDDSAFVARHRALFVGTGRAGSLQQPARGQAARPGGAGSELRPGDRAHGTDRAEVLPADFSYDWGGTSYQEKKPAARRPSRWGSR